MRCYLHIPIEKAIATGLSCLAPHPCTLLSVPALQLTSSNVATHEDLQNGVDLSPGVFNTAELILQRCTGGAGDLDAAGHSEHQRAVPAQQRGGVCGADCCDPASATSGRSRISQSPVQPLNSPPSFLGLPGSTLQPPRPRTCPCLDAGRYPTLLPDTGCMAAVDALQPSSCVSLLLPAQLSVRRQEH